jgi:mannose/fructose/N-acetylgalactosamine-specific phosphotransferase system component IIC
VAAALVLGPKGVVGFVAGLGFASLLEAIRFGPSLQALSLGLGLSATTTFAFQFLGENTTLSRDAKMSLLVPLSICLLVIAVVLTVVSPKVTAKGAEAK